MIYFIRDDATGHIKIGYAANPWGRLSKIQSDTPARVALVAIEEGDHRRERELHAEFAEHRARGEWFRPNRDLNRYIAGLGTPERETASHGPRFTWGGSGLNDDALAEIVGISRAHLCKIRRGKCMPSLRLAFDIAEATGVNILSLMQAQPTTVRRAA